MKYMKMSSVCQNVCVCVCVCASACAASFRTGRDNASAFNNSTFAQHVNRSRDEEKEVGQLEDVLAVGHKQRKSQTEIDNYLCALMRACVRVIA